MVCKDEVWLWFKKNEPHRRLELVCGLLNMCLPMELRFISTCVEDLGKRDFHDLREAEYKANNAQEIKRLSNLLDERTRSNLIVYIALLSSRNHTCSTLLYQILVDAPQDPPITDVNHIKEMLLIYTMVLHHPAFTFEQKRVIAELHGRSRRLEAQHQQELDTHLLDAFPGCAANAEGCDSGLSVGTEPEGDNLLESCTLLPTPGSQLQYHTHTQSLQKSVGGLATSQTSGEGGGSQDACSSGSGESSELYNEGVTVSTTIIYNSIFEQQRLVALTPSYPYGHSNLHYYQYPQMVGNVSGCAPDGKGSNSEGSSSEEGPHNGMVQNGPPTSSSPLSSPQSSPYVSPLQSLSPSRASSPMSRPATTTTTSTTTTAASFPPTVTTSATVPTNLGMGTTHSSPRSGHKSPVRVTQATGTHTGTHTGPAHRGKPPSAGVRSHRQSDRSASRSRLPTCSSGDCEVSLGSQTPQNSPTSVRGTAQTSLAAANGSSHTKNISRWPGSHSTASTLSTSTSPTCAASTVSNNKNATRQSSQSPCPLPSSATSCRISLAANSPVSKTATTSNLGCSTAATIATVVTTTSTATTTLTTAVTTIAAAANTTTSTTTVTTTSAATTTGTTTTATTATTTRNTSPPVVVHGGNQDKNAHTISTNSSARPLSSIVGSSSINPSTLEKCPVNNNNCLNQEYIKQERLSKYYSQLACLPVDKLKRMSDRDILELGLTRGALSKLRRVLATIESPSNHIPNGFTNHSVIMPHQFTSSHGSFSSPSHTPLSNHSVTSSSVHSLSASQTCSQSQQLSTTTNQGKTGGTSISETSQNASLKAKNSPINTLAFCKESSGCQLSGTNNSSTGSPALLQGSLSNLIPSTTTVPGNAPTTPTTVTTISTTTIIPSQTLNYIPVSTNSTTTAAVTKSTAVTSDNIVNTSTASATIASAVNVTQCHSVTISSSQKGPIVSSQQPPTASTASVETTSSPTTTNSHGPHTATVSAASQTRSSLLSSLSTTPSPASFFPYMTTPPPPYSLKTTPPPTGLPQHPVTSQPPPNQHRISPPSLCAPPRTPSQEPSTPSTSSGIANSNGSQQVYYNNSGPGGKNLPSVSSTINVAASSMNVAGYTAPHTGNPPHSSSGGSVAMPVYTSAGNMPVYTSSSSIGVPPPSNGGLVPMVPPGGHYPTYLYSVLGAPGGTHSYVPPGPYGVQQPHRSYYFSNIPQMGPMSHIKAAPQHHGTPISSVNGSRGGSSSSSSSSSSCSSSTRMNKGNLRGQSQIKVSPRSSDSSPSSSQYSSPPQTPSPDHTRDNLPDKRGKAHGDGAEICEAGESLGLGTGASEEGTPPPFHHPPHPVLLPPQANLPRHRGIPYPQLSYLGFHSGAMRYPGPPLPNQGPIIPPRNPLPLNNDKSSRETTPPAPGALPLVPPDPHCCVRSPEGIAVPSSLAGNSHGRNGGSPHTTASHTDGPQPPVTHTPVPSVASAPTVQVPPGNPCTGAPHSSVQYNTPGYQMVPVFQHFTGFVPTHSSLANGFVSPPMPPNFAFPNMGSGINPDFVYSGQYSILGGTTQGGGGPNSACGTPTGIGAPTPGLGLAAGMPYTHYPPNLPPTPNPSAGAKKSCYNCGQVGHHGAECKEANIEEMCTLPKAARS